MKLTSLLILNLCLFACSTTQQTQVHGLWFYSESGVYYKETKSCDFDSDGSFKCDITELGFSEQFGDAHKYQTLGKWLLENDTLELIYAPTYATEVSTKIRYSILKLSNNMMVLRNQNGKTEEWHNSNGL